MPDEKARPAGRPSRTRAPKFVKNKRGVRNWHEARDWLEWRSIEDIECITPDQAGVARGKMMPRRRDPIRQRRARPVIGKRARIRNRQHRDVQRDERL